MIVKELAEKLNLKIAAGEKGLDREIRDGYCGDLLSDVMAHCPEDSIFITVQNHKNSVAVATLVGAVAILVVHDREIPKDMLDAAQAEHVMLLRTGKDQFEASCLVSKILSLS